MIDFSQEIKKYESFDTETVKKLIFKEEGSENDSLLRNKYDQVAKRFGLALNYCKTDSFDLAYIQIKKVTRLVPEFINAQMVAALICLHEGKADQAVEALDEILKYDPSNQAATDLKAELVTPPAETDDADAGKNALAYEENSADKKEKPSKKLVPSIKKKEETPKQQTAVAVVPKKMVADGSDYEEVTSNKKSFIYLGIGFLIGVIAMFVLVVPTARSAVKNQYANEASNYEDQIKAKETEIEDLNSQLKDAQDETSDYKKKLKTFKGSNKNLSLAAEELLQDHEIAAAEALLKVDKSALSDKQSKELYDYIKDNSFSEAADGIYKKGLNQWYSSDYKKAATYFKEAIKCDDSKGDYYYYLGRCYEAQKKTDKAIKQYNNAINHGTKNSKDAKSRVDKLSKDSEKTTEEGATTEATTEKTN